MQENSPIQDAGINMTEEIGYDPDFKSKLDAMQQISFDQSSEELLEALISKLNPNQQEEFRNAYKAEFELAVKRSREQHIAFVKQHRGPDAEVKFADALADETYFVSFFITSPKQRNIVIPPIDLNGRPERVRPGALYSCTGAEARMMERVLASKKIEILNITPKREGLNISVNWIVNNWAKLYPPANPVKRRDAFASYREQPDENDTVKIKTNLNVEQGEPE